MEYGILAAEMGQTKGSNVATQGQNEKRAVEMACKGSEAVPDSLATWYCSVMHHEVSETRVHDSLGVIPGSIFSHGPLREPVVSRRALGESGPSTNLTSLAIPLLFPSSHISRVAKVGT